MPCRRSRYSEWWRIAVVVAAASGVAFDLRATAAPPGDPPRAHGTVLVHTRSAAGPAVVAPGSSPWLDGAAVERIEWRYGGTEPIAPVSAAAGVGEWLFVVDASERRATLDVTDEIRRAWDERGRLAISVDDARAVELRWRPRALDIPSDGARFQVRLGTEAVIPGSRGWAAVVLDPPSRLMPSGWTHVGVRAVEGERLGPSRLVYEGRDAAVFWIGDEEYALRIERVKQRLFGRGDADLIVTSRWSPREAGRIDTPADVASGTPSPYWFQTIDRIERELSAVEQKIGVASKLLDAGRIGEASSVVAEGRHAQERARDWLSSLWRPRSFPIGTNGAAFTAEQYDRTLVPGSRGWVEVALGDIHWWNVTLGVRTVAGRTLATSRSLAKGDESEFWIGDEPYAIRVEGVTNRLIGRDEASLRLVRRDTQPMQQEEGVDPGPTVGARILELIDCEAETAAKHLERAVETLLADSSALDDARPALEAAKRSEGEVRLAIRWFERLMREDRRSSIDELSLVRAKVVSAHPSFDLEGKSPLDEIEDPVERALIRGMHRLTDLALRADEVYAQEIEALIVEAPAVGNRYAFATSRWREFPTEKRRDLDAGQTVELHLWEQWRFFPGVRGLEEGAEYWLAVTPPLALKGIPRRVGESGRTWVVFALRASDRPR